MHYKYFKKRWIQYLNTEKFTCIYIDDILVFSKTKTEHFAHLHMTFTLFEKHGLIISKKKMKLVTKHREFLGAKIEQGKISLQLHSYKNISIPWQNRKNKELRFFLGLLNYVKPYLKDIGKLSGPLYNKTSIKGQKHFNQQDINLVKQIKEMVKSLPTLALPLDNDYLVVKTDGYETGWGGALFRKTTKFDPKSTESLCRYALGKYREKGHLTSLYFEILAVIYCLDAFLLFIYDKKEITIWTDCEAIVKYNNQTKGTRTTLSTKRWIIFTDTIINKGLKYNRNI